MGFFDSKDGSNTSTTDEYFTEETASFLVFQSIDGENLFAVHISQTKDSLDFIKSLTELALVKQHHHIGVVDDGLLHNGTANNILNFLCYHTDTCPELTCCLVEVLDVFCHHRAGNSFPCLFNDKHLTVLLDTHFLDEYIHNNKRYQGEKQRIILDGVNLKDNECLIKQCGIQVFIQGLIVIATSIEVLHHIAIGTDVDALNLVFLTDVGNTLHTELIEGVK